MTFKKLIRESNILKTLDWIIKNYYKDKNNYEKWKIKRKYLKVWKNLLKLEGNSEIEKIILQDAKWNGKEYISIYGKKEIEKFALDFCDWNDLINAEIINKSFKIKTKEEILSHLLWEITFYGFSQKKINKRYNRLLKAAKQIEKKLKKLETKIKGEKND